MQAHWAYYSKNNCEKNIQSKLKILENNNISCVEMQYNK
jgi:hypothetical protein